MADQDTTQGSLESCVLGLSAGLDMVSHLIILTDGEESQLMEDWLALETRIKIAMEMREPRPYKVGDTVIMKQSYAYPGPVQVVAVSKSGMCVKLQDAGETLLVLYSPKDLKKPRVWHDGLGHNVIVKPADKLSPPYCTNCGRAEHLGPCRPIQGGKR